MVAPEQAKLRKVTLVFGSEASMARAAWGAPAKEERWHRVSTQVPYISPSRRLYSGAPSPEPYESPMATISRSLISTVWPQLPSWLPSGRTAVQRTSYLASSGKVAVMVQSLPSIR